jgi:Predicted transcriptional regulators
MIPYIVTIEVMINERRKILVERTELDEFIESIRSSDGSGECAVKHAIDIVGGKWKLNILALIVRSDNVRFNEMKRRIYGITNTMLTNTLKELEMDKLIQRTQYNEMPLRVEYSLTEKGRNILPALLELSKWWKQNKTDM